jgi:hypothetical protein
MAASLLFQASIFFVSVAILKRPPATTDVAGEQFDFVFFSPSIATYKEVGFFI